MDDFLLVAKWLAIFVLVVFVLACLGAFLYGMYQGIVDPDGARSSENASKKEDSDAVAEERREDEKTYTPSV